MRTVHVAAGLLLLSGLLLGQTSPPRVLTRTDFGPPTLVTFQTPVGAGDWAYGQGGDIRREPGPWHVGHWHVYATTWGSPNPPGGQRVTIHELPASLSGTATYVQMAGVLQHYGQLGGDGVFVDEVGNRVCESSGSAYTTANGQPTLSCAPLDPATGKFTTRTNAETGVVETDNRRWNYQVCDAKGVCKPRPDRMTQSGILRIRNEAIAQKLGGHYVAGFGGTYSIISNGISMGLSACAFELPAQTFVGSITCTPLLGYPVEPHGGSTYMNRDGNYTQALKWDANPPRGSDAVKKYGTGKFAPEDGLSGMAADVVDVPGGEAFVGVAELQTGCIAYGDNYLNLPPVIPDAPAVAPQSTNLTTGAVLIPRAWNTGQMVNVVGSTTPSPRPGTGGLTSGGYKVYFLRKVGTNLYTFNRNYGEAMAGAPGIIPTSTDVATNIVRFLKPHGIVTQTKVTVRTTTGGLAAGTYYVNASRPYELSFHRTYEDSDGYPFTAAKNAIDLTGSVASQILAPVIKPTAAITAGIQPMSYCQAPAEPFIYPKAAVGSQGATHALYFYSIEDLAAVRRGEKAQNALQPKSYVNLGLPSVTYPVPGMNKRPITSAQWIPELSRYAIMWSDLSPTKQGRRMAFYPVAVAGLTTPTARAAQPAAATAQAPARNWKPVILIGLIGIVLAGIWSYLRTKPPSA